MHREKRQNRITEQRKIQKEICRILLIFTMILSMICVVNLTGCRDRKSQEQTELISLDGREPDVEKADGNTAKEAEGSEAGTDDNMTEKDGLKQEKLQICYVHVCGAVKSPGVYELTSDSRLYEAIQMAGGFTDEAAGEALNQAEKIEDGSRIYVPTPLSDLNLIFYFLKYTVFNTFHFHQIFYLLKLSMLISVTNDRVSLRLSDSG